MRKNICGVVIILLAASFLSCEKTNRSPGNSIARNSIDWAGVYTGVIPSASGMGINVRFTLNADETYTVEYQYIGKSDEVFPRTGTFTWNPEGDTIILDSVDTDDFPPYYKVGENTLTHLDIEGNIITGDLADDYVLRKQQGESKILTPSK